MTVDNSAAMAPLDAMEKAIVQELRPAVQAGAQVFYDEVHLRVPVMAEPTVNNGKLIQPGALKAAIYQAFSKDQSTDTLITYHISWNKTKAPHGHLVEYGHIMTRAAYKGSDGNWYTSPEPLPTPKHVGARPFLRPAFDARAQAAAEAVSARFVLGMQRFAR